MYVIYNYRAWLDNATRKYLVESADNYWGDITRTGVTQWEWFESTLIIYYNLSNKITSLRLRLGCYYDSYKHSIFV